MVLLCWTLVAAVCAAAAVSPAFTCKIDGVQVSFTKGLKAVLSAEGTLIISGFNEKQPQENLIMEIPGARSGQFESGQTLGLRLDYSRSIYSSDSKDYLRAHGAEKGSRFEVRITAIGKVGERVEGRFTATLVNETGRRSNVTDGVFTAEIERPAKSNATSSEASPRTKDRGPRVRRSLKSEGGRTKT